MEELRVITTRVPNKLKKEISLHCVTRDISQQSFWVEAARLKIESDLNREKEKEPN